MHLFYQPDLSANEILLSEDESKHAIRVLRMKKGDEVHLADGKGMHAVAVIEDEHVKKCLLRIISKEQTTKTRNYDLHIMIAPTKNTERIEWFVEKAVEAGIDRITFIQCAHSERVKLNTERCLKVAISAMKQSKQWHLPQIDELVKLNEAIGMTHSEQLKMIAWCETPSTQLLQQQLSSSSLRKVCVMIGPEGDFTSEETTLAQGAGFVPVSLGENILRTETAALYACMATKALLS